MYEVHPDNKGQWLLYKVEDGELLPVAWFVERGDAEFCREAFEKRTAAQQSAPGDGTTDPDHVIAEQV